jgi:phosphomannomutase
MSRPSHIKNTAVTGIETSDGFRFLLADRNWLLIRFSGTEPILRVYAESDSIARVDGFLEAGREMAGV